MQFQTALIYTFAFTAISTCAFAQAQVSDSTATTKTDSMKVEKPVISPLLDKNHPANRSRQVELHLPGSYDNNSRSEYVIQDGRVVGGSTTFKSKSKSKKKN